jgi:peptidoglycan/LPS O-acetylase OafA/YrhL
MSEQAQVDIRRERINSLFGLKVVALAIVFGWHLGVFTRPDLGARMVEFFFACSGVLEAMRHFGTYSYTLEETYENFKRRLAKIYPVHLLTFVLAVILGQLGVTAWVFSRNKVAGVLSLFMLQVWDARTMFAFNGVSWFLCDLLICYAFTPFMSYVVQRARGEGDGWQRVWLLLTLTIALRVVIDIAVGHGAVAIAVHTFPPVRLLDYFMVYVCGCLLLGWREGRGPVRLGRPVQTAIEVTRFSSTHGSST